jgi:uncharacterized protein (TIGR02145 family)
MKTTYSLLSVLLLVTCKLGAQTVTDFDGNVYNTVTIGTQEWIKSNLNVKHFNNGDAIPLITDNTNWWNTTTATYSFYNNDVLNEPLYGALYNGYVIFDTRNVCPTGWHVPSDNDWVLLFRTICTSGNCATDWQDNNVVGTWQGTDEGGKLKEIGTTFWNSPNTGATNSSGMSILPGGYRYWDGNSYTLNDYTNLWTKTMHSDGVNAWFYAPIYNRNDIYHGYGDLHNGMSIRCVRPAQFNGLIDEKSKDIKVYPNPAKDELIITSISQNKYKIIDLAGKMVGEGTLIPGANHINLLDITSGMYFIEFENNGSIQQLKFTKE